MIETITTITTTTTITHKKKKTTSPRKKYETNFKEKMIKLYEQKMPLKEISSKYKIPYSTLHNWITQYKIKSENFETTTIKNLNININIPTK